jgi:hypothetical protein
MEGGEHPGGGEPRFLAVADEGGLKWAAAAGRGVPEASGTERQQQVRQPAATAATAGKPDLWAGRGGGLGPLDWGLPEHSPARLDRDLIRSSTWSAADGIGRTGTSSAKKDAQRPLNPHGGGKFKRLGELDFLGSYDGFPLS